MKFKFDTLVEQLLGEQKERVALLPGGFKPPHKGHFKALSYILQDADRGIVYIGNKERDGVTAEQAKQIWEIYKKYLPRPIDIEIAKITPVKSVYDFVDANLDKPVIVGASGDEDLKRFEYFKKHVEKYPLVTVVNIPPQYNRISGTEARKKITGKESDAVEYFVPEISDKDLLKIKNILLTS